MGAGAGPVATAGGHVVNGSSTGRRIISRHGRGTFRSVSTETNREADASDTGPHRRHAALRETEATVRAVDYQVIGGGAEEFRVYSDDEHDVARWRRVETPVTTPS